MKLLILFVILGVCSAGTLNGQRATIDEYPFLASVQAPGHRGRHHICAGVIVSSRLVLTAGHCLDYFEDPRAFMARVGVTQHDNGGMAVDYSVMEKIYHPNYKNDSSEFDLALLKVDTNIEFGNSVSKILLGTVDDINPKVDGLLTGWGAIYVNGLMSPVLNSVAMRTVDNVECQIGHEQTITENMLCVSPTATLPEGMCEGEAGSPFTVGLELVGIASWGMDCDLMTRPGVLTRLTPDIRKWINESIVNTKQN